MKIKKGEVEEWVYWLIHITLTQTLILIHIILESQTKEKKYKISREDNVEIIGRTKSNKLINIEIQVGNKGNMGKRSIYYASGILFHSLPVNTPYNQLPKLIMINILDYKTIII